jgi:hypothetical protein
VRQKLERFDAGPFVGADDPVDLDAAAERHVVAGLVFGRDAGQTRLDRRRVLNELLDRLG